MKRLNTLNSPLLKLDYAPQAFCFKKKWVKEYFKKIFINNVKLPPPLINLLQKFKGGVKLDNYGITIIYNTQHHLNLVQDMAVQAIYSSAFIKIKFDSELHYTNILKLCSCYPKIR